MLSENPSSAPHETKVAGEGPRCPQGSVAWGRVRDSSPVNAMGSDPQIFLGCRLTTALSSMSHSAASLAIFQCNTHYYQGEKVWSNSILETPVHICQRLERGFLASHLMSQRVSSHSPVEGPIVGLPQTPKGQVPLDRPSTVLSKPVGVQLVF